MTVTRLNRNLTGPDALQPGEWASHVEPHISGTMITIVISCPLCGSKEQLTAEHVIDADTGNVKPAFVCSSCPLFELIRLDEYAEVPR